MAELVDAGDLKSPGLLHAGSSPALATNFTPITGWLGGNVSNQSFRKGEIAILVSIGDGGINPNVRHMIGSDVEILELPGYYITKPHHYRIKFIDGLYGYALPAYLRKRRPPEQPSAFTYQEILDMCNDKTITCPTEETIRRTFVNGMWSPR